VDLSPDGRTVLGRAFPASEPENRLAAAFTPDGHRLFIVSDTSEAWAWDVDQASWKA
jgi:hypothetical protein